MIKKCAYYFLLCLFPCAALAAKVEPSTSPFMSSDFLTHFEISIAGGPLKAYANDTTLVVSPSETDRVGVKQVAGANLWRLGIGYSLFAEQLQDRKFFNSFLVELNLYHGNQTRVRGSVWQYQLPQFNNYHFSAPAKSTRLMLDLKPRLFTWKGMSPYPIMGLGITKNTISYTETVTGVGVDPNSALVLSKHSNIRFAFDLGAGVSVDLSEHIAASVEYLYTNLGSIAPSKTPSNNLALMSPPSFTLTNQALLLGFTWKV